MIISFKFFLLFCPLHVHQVLRQFPAPDLVFSIVFLLLQYLVMTDDKYNLWIQADEIVINKFLC